MDKRIKLLFVAEELATNGAMMSLLALLKSLPADKYEISLFLFRHNEKISIIPKNIHVLKECFQYSVHRMSLKEGLKTCLQKGALSLFVYRLLLSVQRFFHLNYRLWKFLPNIEGNYDVACCYTDGFVAPMILNKTNALKKIAWIHFLYSDWPQESFVYKALRNMDACIPVSNEAGKDLDKILECKVQQYVVHNITDITSIAERADALCDIPRKKGVYRIVSVGRVTPQKNFDIIPDVAQKLKEKGIIFEWLIIGEGEERQNIQNKVDFLGLSGSVHMVGNRSNPMPYVKSADVVFIPSRFESWGMTISEALCLGKAVVASNLPVFKEQIKQGHNGIMCPAIPSVMADTIEEVLRNDAIRHKLETNALNYPFTKDVILAEFDNMIEKVLDKN